MMRIVKKSCEKWLIKSTVKMASGIMERYMENIVTKDRIVSTKGFEGWMIKSIVNLTIIITKNVISVVTN
jgi:hypothetical protein